MSKVTYQDPIQSTSGKIFGKKQHISQRKLFGLYESTYCYQNKPEHWSDAQTLHRQKMGAASLYAKLLLQDPDFAARATAYRLELLRRANNPRSAADKKLKPYLRNQQMLTSLIYNYLSTATATADASTPPEPTAEPTVEPAANPTAEASLAQTILAGYARYAAAHPLNRKAILAELIAELSALPLAEKLLPSLP